jgi:glycosyltransferase involved in cell wall biosynthesis
MITVIICSHNPNTEFLNRAINALKIQTLPKDHWELLLVDNASKNYLREVYNLSWHPRGKHVHEANLGLTHARLRGISEAEGSTLIFVDDDNVLEPNYLECALNISKSHSFLGAWGGSCIAEYQKKPPEWFNQFESNLAVRKIESASWSNQYFNYASTPVGAGMCIRRTVAEAYRLKLSNDVYGLSLDRKGASLMSCGDHDMAWTSIDLGLGVGVFPELNLIHIIPQERTDFDYIIKLLESDACSSTLLRLRMNLDVKCPSLKKKYKLTHPLALSIRKYFSSSDKNIKYQVKQAKSKGIRRAFDIWRNRI